MLVGHEHALGRAGGARGVDHHLRVPWPHGRGGRCGILGLGLHERRQVVLAQALDGLRVRAADHHVAQRGAGDLG